MHASKPTPARIVKGNRFENFKCSRNRYEIDQMNMIPYASAVGSLMSVQVQVRTYPDVVLRIRDILIEVQSRYRSLEWS